MKKHLTPLEILSQLLATFFLLAVFVLASPFILYHTVTFIGDIYFSIEDHKVNKTIQKASESITPFYVNHTPYDITTIVFGIANTNIKYTYKNNNYVFDLVH